MALTGDKRIDLFHTTGETRLLSETIGQDKIDSLVLSPRNNTLLVESGDKF